MKTITFIDHGQDFLEWDVDSSSGKVVDCRPAQGFLWRGHTVVNHEQLRAGQQALVQAPDGGALVVNYPVKSVRTLSTSRVGIKVRLRASTYITATVCGVRASCTAGAMQAAEAWGRKYFKDAFRSVEPAKGPCAPGEEHWTVIAMHPVPDDDAPGPAPTPERIKALEDALDEAIEQLQGWVNWGCPKKHLAKHTGNIARLRAVRAGG